MCWSSYDRRDRHSDRGYRVADRVPAEPASPPVAAAPPPRDPDLRVSQAERDAVVSVLAGHYADGRLSLGEYEDRVAAALAATTGRDLDALFTDLPGGVPAPPAPAVPATGPRPPGPSRGASRPPGVPSFPRRQGPGFSGMRVPAVVAIVALSFLAGPWALFLLWPVLAMTSGACGPHRSHHARPRANDWDRLDDREPVRML